MFLGKRGYSAPAGGGHYHHHLIQYHHPEKEYRTVTDLVTFHLRDGKMVPDHRHLVPSEDGQEYLFQCCPLGLKDRQKALLLDFKLLYTLSDFDMPLQFAVETMFPVDDRTVEMAHHDVVVEDDEMHPDFTGSAVIHIPPSNLSGPLPSENRVIYRPRFYDLAQGGFNVPQYAGTEGHILNARSNHIMVDELSHLRQDDDPENQYVAFLYTDPFVVFVMEHRHHFKEERSDDIRILEGEAKQGGSVYLIRRPFVERIQQFFKNAVYPHFNYTTNDAIRFAWKTGPKQSKSTTNDPVVAFMVQLDYMIISPHLPRIEVRGTQIKV